MHHRMAHLTTPSDVAIVEFEQPIPPFSAGAALKAFVISTGGERESWTVNLIRSVGFEVTVLRPPSYERNLSLAPICRQNFAQMRAIQFAARQTPSNSESESWKDWIWIFEDELFANPETPHDLIQQSIVDFMQSKYAKQYTVAYLAGCTIMKLDRLAHLRSGVDISNSCFLCTHAYGLHYSRARTLEQDIHDFDQHFLEFCNKHTDINSRLPLDVVLFKLCKIKGDNGAAVVIGGKLRSPIDEHRDTQMGLFYRDRTRFDRSGHGA